MALGIHRRKTPKEFIVELDAVLDGNPSPLGMGLSGIGESPLDLDLAVPGKPDNRHAPETGRLTARERRAL